jgi:hypothetical protein
MWLEMLRGSEQPGTYREMRVRVAHLLDHEPSAPVPTRPTPSSAPYGISGPAAEQTLRKASAPVSSGRIAGTHSGYLEFEREAGDLSQGRAASSNITYVDYSDDGRTFYTGFEQARSSFVSDTVYQADLELTGDHPGEMRLRATWSGRQDGSRLLFDRDADGRPKSHGFARYGGVQLNIEDLVE